jgi:hypothetical protein
VISPGNHKVSAKQDSARVTFDQCPDVVRASRNATQSSDQKVIDAETNVVTRFGNTSRSSESRDNFPLDRIQ